MENYVNVARLVIKEDVETLYFFPQAALIAGIKIQHTGKVKILCDNKKKDLEKIAIVVKNPTYMTLRNLRGYCFTENNNSKINYYAKIK